ncbi:MAG: response regulator [Anaerolineales bacterium]|nr:response regulator [Anaerolineales bacterium]MCA9928800.1 response regulator [Anaerolineales bacterium]
MAESFLPLSGDHLAQSVLIVDDEPMARTLLRLMLVRAGYHVSEAEDGFDALEKVRINRPDVILLDVMMPGMDGFTVCETLRKDNETAKLPIIMLSAKTDLDSINKGLLVGATKYLMKPISPEDLTRHVRETLDHGIEAH